MKKYFEVMGVIHARERGRLTVDSKEVVAAKIRKFFTQEVIDDLNILVVALGIKVGRVFCSSQSNASIKKWYKKILTLNQIKVKQIILK